MRKSQKAIDRKQEQEGERWRGGGDIKIEQWIRERNKELEIKRLMLKEQASSYMNIMQSIGMYVTKWILFAFRD